MPANPRLTYIVNFEINSVIFNCSTTLTGENGTIHTILWLVGNVQVGMKILPNNEANDFITDTALPERLAALLEGVSFCTMYL